MTDYEKEQLKGRYAVIAAVIGALGAIISAVIGFYAVVVPLREQNTELQMQNDALVEDSQEAEGETSTMQDTISALETRISDLEGTVSNLRDENAKLTTQYETVQANYTSLEAENKRLNDELITASTTIESIQSLDTSQADSQSGKSGQDLLVVCPPYETYRYEAPDRLSVMGDKYKNAFSLCAYYITPNVSYAYFNLRGQYKLLEFDVGHVDGSGNGKPTLQIFLDGEEYGDVLELHPDMMLTHYLIPVTGVNQVKIYAEGKGEDSNKYGFVNGKLS